MNRSPRAVRPARSVAGVLAAAVLLSPLALTGQASADEPAPAPGPVHVPVITDGPGTEHYVALGDSFASGPGINPQRAGGCERSEKNYASVFAAQLDVATFTDASCAGATTAHFEDAQTRSGGVNAPQLDALDEETTLVTFGTMGGNDVGLVGLAQDCGYQSATCLPAAGTDPLAAKFDQVRLDLTAALAEVQRRAPKADVMVVGYGTYVPPGGCPAFFLNLIDADEFDYVQEQIDRLSDLLRDVAADAGAHFVDQREIPGAIDHTVCAREADQGQWIRGINTYDDGALFHPSTAGMKATADFLAVQYAEMKDRGEHVAPKSPTPSVKPTPVTPTKAQRLAALRKKASSAKVSASCHSSRRTGTVTLRVKGGKGTISSVTFRAGAKKVAVDRRAPWSVKKKSATVRKALTKKSSKVRAVVTFRDGGVSLKRTLVLKKRPACLR